MGSINYQILGVKGLKFCLTSFQRVIMYLFVSNLSLFVYSYCSLQLQ